MLIPDGLSDVAMRTYASASGLAACRPWQPAASISGSTAKLACPSLAPLPHGAPTPPGACICERNGAGVPHQPDTTPPSSGVPIAAT